MGPRTCSSQFWLPLARYGRGAAAVVGVAALLGGPPAAARAQAPTAAAAVPSVAPPTELKRQQVRQLVHEAGQLMDRGDRTTAVTRLQKAQALWPDPSLDYNLGVAYAELGQHPAAARALGRFLDSADRGAVLSERLDDARRRLVEYQRTLSRLKVQATLPVQAQAATLAVDSERPGDQDASAALPLTAPLWLPPGAHRVRVTASGARDYEVKVELQPGELRQLTAELLPLTAVSSLVPSSPELRHATDSTPAYKKWWFWPVVGGSAAVLTLSLGLVVAGATGKLSHVAAGSDLEPVDVAR